MRRWVLAAFLSCCCTAARVVSADEGTPESATQSAATANSAKPAPSADAIDGAFSTLVMLGDKAQRQGQLTDAIAAYRKALALRDDPAVVGKLGLLYALGGAPEMATRNLLVALERGGGTPLEKKEFFRVFQQTRPQVCLLHVLGNVFDAEVSIDASPFRKEMGPTFKLFVMPGKHVVRGKAPNGDEAVVEKECPKGGEETATLQWNLPARVEAVESLREDEAEAPLPAPPMRPGRLLKERIARDPMLTAVDDEPPPRAPIVGGVLGEEKMPRAHGAVGAGPVVVLGVASWMPAIGIGVGGSVYANEYVSLDLDARAAWLTTGVAGEPGIRAMTAGALLGVCGHWRWAFGCLTGHIGVIDINSTVGYTKASFTFVKPGIGGRLGLLVPLVKSFGMSFTGDVVGLSSGVGVRIDEAILVEQPPILVTIGTAATWTF